jgi:hypothetical protein
MGGICFFGIKFHILACAGLPSIVFISGGKFIFA